MSTSTACTLRTPKILIALLLACCSTSAKADTTRVLFIGNSYIYSNDLPGMFRQLALSMGDTVETGMSAPGGHTFELHTTNAATQAAIALATWDFVVLQEQSQMPSFPPEQVAVDVYPFATQLVQQIHAANACTEVVFMMTWGRENGDAANCASYPPLCTYEGMQQRLRDSYVEMAMDNSSWCAPIGAVWKEHRTTYPTTALYSDGSHPNVLGSYIAASTLVSSIFRRACTPATYQPAGLTVEQTLNVRTMASAIVADSAGTWNIGVNDPVAEFSWSDVGESTILFANNTTGAVEQHWDFGDGSTSEEFDPLHTYSSPGAFVVTLITADACGRTDTTTTDVLTGGTGVEDTPLTPMAGVTFDKDQRLLSIRLATDQARLDLLDTAGRSLWSQPLKNGTNLLPLTSSWSGVLLWRIIEAGGQLLTGRIVVP